jgi:stress response protein SCP2
MINLAKGQRLPLANIIAGNTVGVELRAEGLPFDFVCFGVDAQGKLSDDRYMTFFNQPKSPCGGIAFTEIGGDLVSMIFEMSKIPNSIDRVIIAGSIDGSGTMSTLKTGYLKILDAKEEKARFTFSGSDFNAEKAVMLGEFYRKDGQWRFMTIGQGFNGGLDTLVTHFGGTVNSEPPTKEIPNSPASTIILEKAGARISLVKEGWDLRSVSVGIGWQAKGKKIDLDLFALALDAQGRLVDHVPRPMPWGNGRQYSWSGGVERPTPSIDGSIRHTGDSKGGTGREDNEILELNLQSVSPTTDRIAIGLCSYLGRDAGVMLGGVKSAYLRAVDAAGKEIFRYRIEEAGQLWKDVYTVFLGEFSRGAGGWQFASLDVRFSEDSQVDIEKSVRRSGLKGVSS